jgi:hypothetical protein
MNTNITDTAITGTLRSTLLELARRQDNLAADELAATPYWSPCPSSAIGQRTAAVALRAEADLLLAAS